MSKYISVDQAISKGHQRISYPVFALFLSLLGVNIYLGKHHLIPDWMFAVTGPGMFLIVWLYWSISVPKWKLWAYSHVRNVHELNKRALQEELYKEEGSFIAKTEIWSHADKLQWEVLKDRFLDQDEFIDDLTIPEESIIYYSKSKNIFELLLMLIVSSAGIYLLVHEHKVLLGIIVLFSGLVMAYFEFREVTNTTPQIILNDRGIELNEIGFFSWRSISNEIVHKRGSAKNPSFVLCFNHSEGSEEYEIDDLATDQYTLEKLMRVYRGRFENA